ncbi:MAG: threonine synthase [Anaerolineales bacterium]
MSALLGLACPECGETFDADQLQTVCQACDSPLLAEYDLARLARSLNREAISRRQSGLWRWAELLPVDDASFRHSLGEGDTPLLRLRRLGEELGLDALYLKDEGVNPSGTFKARGLAVGVSRALELGVRDFVIPTAGNAGGALALYAARAGVKAHIFMPRDAPVMNQVEVLRVGAELKLVKGLIDQAGREASKQAKARDWFDISTFKEPYRVEGKKTMGLEIAESFDWQLPEVIVYPTGGGTGLVGMWKAFSELEGLGWIDHRRPRLASVQAAGCAPLVRAMERGEERTKAWKRASTRAAGLRVPKPFADRLILRVLRQSQGTAVAVSEKEIQQSQAQLARHEGVFACPEGAATLAGLRHLISAGWISRHEKVVLLNTGTGLKYQT